MVQVAFLDTNVFMHCQPIREIPWRDVLGADQVLLIVSRTVVSELDEQKDTNTRQALRDRARRALQEIERWATPATLREGVTVAYYARTPTIDVAELRQDRADDVLIATILQYRLENAGADVLLVTNDTGPRLTARHLGIAAVELPEQYRLGGQPDPLEQENARLRAELQKLQRAHPAPRVRFSDDTDRLNFAIRPGEAFDPGAVAEELAELRRLHRPMWPPSTHGLLSNVISEAVTGVAPLHEYQRYNAELEDYFSNYESNIRRQWERRQADRWTVELALSLHNKGGAPATDMDVDVTFQATGSLLDFDPRYDRVVPPPLPRKPQSQLELMRSSLSQDVYHPPLINDILTMHRNVSDADFQTDDDQHRIAWSIRQLKHGYQIDFKPVYLVFASEADARSFSVGWNVHAGNYPEPVTGQLHVVVS